MKKATISLTILVLLFSMVLTGDNNLVYAETKGQEQRSILLNLSSDNEFHSDAEYYVDFQHYSIPAFDGDIEQDGSPPSIDRAPLSISEGDGVVSLNSEAELYGINSAPSAYGVDLLSDNFYRWPDLTLPHAAIKINEKEMTAKGLFAGDFMGENFSTLYAISPHNHGLYAINTLTAEETLIGIVDIPANSFVTGMAGADGVMYVIFIDELDGNYCVEGTYSRLATINLETAKITNVGILPNSTCMIDIAYVPENGMLYGVDLVTDSLHRINPGTASDSIVGSLGIDANYAQGMDYDVSNKILYWTAYRRDGSASELRIIDINTGASAQIGTYPDGQEIDSFSIVSTEDDSFLLYRDGYNFANYGESIFKDLTISDFVQMFGEEAICESESQGICTTPNAQFLSWKKNNRKQGEGGRCEGMSVSALRYFANIDSHHGHENTFSLNKNSSVQRAFGYQTHPVTARNNIAFFHVLQTTNPVMGAKESSRKNDSLSTIVEKISQGLEDPESGLFNLVIRKYLIGDFIMLNGHALTPYAVIDKGDGIFWIKVYDNNHPFNVDNPASSDRHVIVNTISGTWEYDLGRSLGVWRGNHKRIAVIPLSLYSEQPICPWCHTNTQSNTGEQQILFSGTGVLLITDSQGRRLGILGETLYEEIPGAYLDTISGGLGIDDTLIYSLPATDDYTLNLNGQQTKQSGVATLTSYGPGYVVNLENVQVNSFTNDTIIFSDNGTNITYTPSQNQNATLATAVDTANGSWQIEVNGMPLNAGQQTTLSVNTTSESFNLTPNNIDSAEYEIFIQRSSDDGLDMYSHKAVPKNVGETHTIRFGIFKDQNIVILEIDRDGDGVIDESIPLENQANKLYFPVIFD